ncbi:8810_t:CDS:2, partial [Gigaspora rosea]
HVKIKAVTQDSCEIQMQKKEIATAVAPRAAVTDARDIPIRDEQKAKEGYGS